MSAMDEQDRNRSLSPGSTAGKTESADTCCESLRALERMTESLPDMPEQIGPPVPGFAQHAMDAGSSFSWSLLWQDEISCARWFNSNGTVFPRHHHKQREWLIVYRGSMLLRIEDGEEQRLLPGMSAVIEPNVPHSARFIEDCMFLAITVPCSPDWPRSRVAKNGDT